MKFEMQLYHAPGRIVNGKMLPLSFAVKVLITFCVFFWLFQFYELSDSWRGCIGEVYVNGRYVALFRTTSTGNSPQICEKQRYVFSHWNLSSIDNCKSSKANKFISVIKGQNPLLLPKKKNK